MTEDRGFNPFAVAQSQFDRCADLMALDDATRKLLRSPMHEHRFALPVRMDDNQTEIFTAFRVRHNDVRGPALGGVRFHPLETIDTVRALAMWMTWKTALVDVPLGGSMGGVVCDPHALSQPEQERICRAWIRRIEHNIGPLRDLPAPDVMTSSAHMTWMLDEYEAMNSTHRPGSITGKSLGAGGSLGRAEASGYGLVYMLREALKGLSIEPGRSTASVQGFGKVAQHAIELFQRIGGSVSCVSCWSQADQTSLSFRRPEGVDLGQLRAIADRLGGISRDKAAELGYEVLEGDAWLAEDVDILIPAAIENQITSDKVDRVSRQVRIVAEGANAPTSPAAEQELLQRGVFMIPDILANAGGLLCSYFEQVQSNMNYYWRLDEVLSKLDQKMTSAYIATSELAESKGLSLREAALVIAVDRVAQLCRERGWLS